MFNDFRGRAVLITGGTRGIGLACGKAFAQRGAKVVLTHRWGSADEEELRASFQALQASAGVAEIPEPLIVEADASQRADTKALMGRMKEEGIEKVEVFISNVCVVMRGDGVDAHKRRSLLKSLDYSAWPFVAYLHAMEKQFGSFPKYAIATSSDGPDSAYPHYDYVAVAKSVLECFVRYMATHLREEGVKVNVLRTRQVVTDSYERIFGEKQLEIARRFAEYEVSEEEVADTVYAMCSGLMDSMSGQILTLDRGARLVDNMMRLGHRLVDDAPEAKA